VYSPTPRQKSQNILTQKSLASPQPGAARRSLVMRIILIWTRSGMSVPVRRQPGGGGKKTNKINDLARPLSRATLGIFTFEKGAKIFMLLS